MTKNCKNGELPLFHGSEKESRQSRSPQYASGGASGMQMAMPSPDSGNSYPDMEAESTGQDDFLMIQLSSFEGRVGH